MLSYSGKTISMEGEQNAAIPYIDSNNNLSPMLSLGHGLQYIGYNITLYEQDFYVGQ
jgi:hypothetical protein